jgi:hypothetical protein
MQVYSETDACMKKYGTDSDFMMIATLIVQQVSQTAGHSSGIRPIHHLGLIYLNVSEEKEADNPFEILQNMLNQTLPQTLNPFTLYVVNVHLHSEASGLFHEASIVIDGATHVLEYWDSSRPSYFASFYRQLRSNTLPGIRNIMLLPQRSAQIRPASCGFWSLWYIQRRMQGCPADVIDRWFYSKKIATQNRKDIGPRMHLLAAAIVSCWQNLIPQVRELDLSDLETSTQRQNLNMLVALICQCSKLDVVSNLPQQWEQFCRVRYTPQ